jgi:hypothetical protein
MRTIAQVSIGIAGIAFTLMPFLWVHRLFDRSDLERAWMTYFLAAKLVYGASWFAAGICFIAFGYRLSRIQSSPVVWKHTVRIGAIAASIIVGFAQLVISVYRLTTFFMQSGVQPGA